MTRARLHAEQASSLLSVPAADAQYLGESPADLVGRAAAHAQVSRAWSAIGRDQAVVEATARRAACSQGGAK